MGIFSVDFNNTNLDDTNYDEDDPETIIHVRLLACHSKFEKRKAFKKELKEELMLVTWHLLRWWDWYLPEDKKKEIFLSFDNFSSLIF